MTLLDEQNSIDASVVFWIIRHLGVFSPNHFSSLSYQAEFAGIHFDDRSFGNHAQLSVRRWRRILLDANNRQMKSGLQFWMGYVSFLETQTLEKEQLNAWLE